MLKLRCICRLVAKPASSGRIKPSAWLFVCLSLPFNAWELPMKHSLFVTVGAACLAVSLAGYGGVAHAQQNNMSFFVTSAGLGKGGDLGGLEGADKQCQTLAEAAGSTG